MLAINASAERETFAAALIAVLLFLVGPAGAPLMGRDEARFAQASREMLARGEMVVPTFGGVDRYHKPILVYWATMASYALTGVSERAARLPSNLAASLVVGLVAWSARRRWGAGWGLAAGLLLATTAVFFVEARACTADMVMMLPTTAAMLALERLVLGDGGRRTAMVLWLSLGVSLLAKGPVGLAVALASGVAFWLLGRTWGRWKLAAAVLLVVLGWLRLGPTVLAAALLATVWGGLSQPAGRTMMRRLCWWWGVPLMLAVPLPWAAAATLATRGKFLEVAVGHHVIARSLSPLESHAGFPGFYIATAVVALFPCVALLVAALGTGLRRLASDPAQRFLVAWVIGPLVLFELVQTKLVHYWMPSYPAAVLLAVGWLADAPQPRRLAAGHRWLLAAGALLLGLAPALLVAVFRPPDLLPLALVAVLPALAAVGWATRSTLEHPQRKLTTLASLSGLTLLMVVGLFAPRVAAFQPGVRAARRAIEVHRPGELLVVFAARDDELFFYLPLDTVNCRTEPCLQEVLGAGEALLGIARTEGLEAFAKEHPKLHIEVVDIVEGLDLGRGRWVSLALFRPAASEGEGLFRPPPLAPQRPR